MERDARRMNTPKVECHVHAPGISSFSSISVHGDYMNKK